MSRKCGMTIRTPDFSTQLICTTGRYQKEPNTNPAYTARVLDIDTLVNCKDNLRVNSSDRCRTRQQSSSKEWLLVRAQRITSSICGWILIQYKKTLSLLYQCLYPKPMFDPLPAAITWGQQNESVACRKYQGYMIEHDHKGVTTHPCGFIISFLQLRASLEHHEKHGWSIPHATSLELSLRALTPNKISHFTNYVRMLHFCGELFDGQFHLKRQYVIVIHWGPRNYGSKRTDPEGEAWG